MSNHPSAVYSRTNYPNPPPDVTDEDYLDYLVETHRHQLDRSRPLDLHNCRVDAWNIEYPRHRVVDVNLMAHAYRYYANAATRGRKKGAPSMVVGSWSHNHSRYEVSGLNKQSGPPRRTDEERAKDRSWRESRTSLIDKHGLEIEVPHFDVHPPYQCGEKPALRPFFDDPEKAGPERRVYSVAIDRDGEEQHMCKSCRAWVIKAMGHYPGCSEMRIYDVAAQSEYTKDTPLPGSSVVLDSTPMNNTVGTTASSGLHNVQGGNQHSASELRYPVQTSFDPDNARNMGTASRNLDGPVASTSRTSYAHVISQEASRYVIPAQTYASNPNWQVNVASGLPIDDQFNARNMYNNSGGVSSEVYPSPQGQVLIDPSLSYNTQQGGGAYYADATRYYPPF